MNKQWWFDHWEIALAVWFVILVVTIAVAGATIALVLSVP
jgi:hypothetical protein